jgi:hypothetical protein
MPESIRISASDKGRHCVAQGRCKAAPPRHDQPAGQHERRSCRRHPGPCRRHVAAVALMPRQPDDGPRPLAHLAPGRRNCPTSHSRSVLGILPSSCSCNESISTTHLLRRHRTHSRAPPWIPPYDENLSILLSARGACTVAGLRLGRVESSLVADLRRRRRSGRATDQAAPPSRFWLRPPLPRKLPSVINYWVRMTPPHGLKIGGLGMGCRKNAWYCPFRDPEPTI